MLELLPAALSHARSAQFSSTSHPKLKSHFSRSLACGAGHLALTTLTVSSARQEAPEQGVAVCPEPQRGSPHPSVEPTVLHCHHPHCAPVTVQEPHLLSGVDSSPSLPKSSLTSLHPGCPSEAPFPPLAPPPAPCSPQCGGWCRLSTLLSPTQTHSQHLPMVFNLAHQQGALSLGIVPTASQGPPRALGWSPSPHSPEQGSAGTCSAESPAVAPAGLGLTSPRARFFS